MIEVIPFRLTETERCPVTLRVLGRAGDLVVSHGVCHDTLANVVLPTDPFDEFTRRHCLRIGGAWFLKEREDYNV